MARERSSGKFPPVEQASLERFGANVRRLREAAGYSQEAFAHHAKIGRAQYGRIERGRQNVEFTTVLKLARALNVEPAVLFEGVKAG